MVGRLVEQQNVRVRRQGAGQRGAAGFAAGQMRRVFEAGEAQLLDQVAGDIVVILGKETALDIAQGRVVAGKIRLLRQIAHHRARLHEDAARIRLNQFRRYLQKRRFAGAVAPDQRDALAGRHRQVGARQERGAAEGQLDAGKL